MLFRRGKQQSAVRPPIFEFWSWWQAMGAEQLAAAIESGRATEYAQEISSGGQAIDPSLEWETSKGTTAKHALCITSGGVAEFRPLAERWLRAAPASDATWEYHAARQADPSVLSSKLEWGEATLALADTRLQLTPKEKNWSIDVDVFHPLFPSIPAKSRQQITFLVLDWLLGEDDVERWLGTVNALDIEPAAAVGLDALPQAIQEMADRLTPNWVLMRGQNGDGKPMLARASRPLRWIDDPLLDLHSTIDVRYAAARDDQLPTPEDLDALQRLEDDLEATVGSRGRVLAIVTGGGWRTWHLYTDAEDQNSTDIVRRWVNSRSTSNMPITLEQKPDPSWKAIRRYR
ncbi:Family of unknown function [Frankineae bacterium MT45]|nr:Family of unknown function [Frankineae bacterium MT45]